jgi:hypothetical protein
MSIKNRCLFATIAAAFIVAMTSGSAAALRSLEVSTTAVRSTARALTFAGGGEVTCEATLNKTLNTRITKIRGVDAGRVEIRVNEARCRGGRMRALAESQPWRFNYLSFSGTLPNIHSVRFDLLAVAFLVSFFGGTGECLFRGNTQLVTGPNERFTELRSDETIGIRLFRNLSGFFCSEEGVLRGSFTLERTITLRLI